MYNPSLNSFVVGIPTGRLKTKSLTNAKCLEDLNTIQILTVHVLQVQQMSQYRNEA